MTIKMEWTLDGLRDDYDWQCALAFGLRGDYPKQPGDFDFIAELIAASAGENDEASWIAIFRKVGGGYCFLAAGCDYTGWDCQAGGDLYHADTLLDLVKDHVGDEERERLGLDLATLELEATP